MLYIYIFTKYNTYISWYNIPYDQNSLYIFKNFKNTLTPKKYINNMLIKIIKFYSHIILKIHIISFKNNL